MFLFVFKLKFFTLISVCHDFRLKIDELYDYQPTTISSNFKIVFFSSYLLLFYFKNANLLLIFVRDSTNIFPNNMKKKFL